MCDIQFRTQVNWMTCKQICRVLAWEPFEFASEVARATMHVETAFRICGHLCFCYYSHVSTKRCFQRQKVRKHFMRIRIGLKRGSTNKEFRYMSGHIAQNRSSVLVARCSSWCDAYAVLKCSWKAWLKAALQGAAFEQSTLLSFQLKGFRKL